MLPNRNNLPVKGLLLRFFSTFVGELRNLGSRHMKKEEALCSSSIWKRRKFSNCILRWHSGSHANSVGYYYYICMQGFLRPPN